MKNNLNSFQRQLDFGKEINNDVAVCPYCFYEHEDSWEYNLQDGDFKTINCDKCNKPFKVSCNVSITYTTKKEEQC